MTSEHVRVPSVRQTESLGSRVQQTFAIVFPAISTDLQPDAALPTLLWGGTVALIMAVCLDMPGDLTSKTR